MVERNIWDMIDKILGRIKALEEKSERQWISVMREDGEEKRFRTDKIIEVKFGLDDILIHLADIGWEDSILFITLPASGITNAKDGDVWDMNIVTKEELEKLRIELQAVTENHQREDIKKDGSL